MSHTPSSRLASPPSSTRILGSPSTARLLCIAVFTMSRQPLIIQYRIGANGIHPADVEGILSDLPASVTRQSRDRGGYVSHLSVTNGFIYWIAVQSSPRSIALRFIDKLSAALHPQVLNALLRAREGLSHTGRPRTLATQFDFLTHFGPLSSAEPNASTVGSSPASDAPAAELELAEAEIYARLVGLLEEFEDMCAVSRGERSNRVRAVPIVSQLSGDALDAAGMLYPYAMDRSPSTPGSSVAANTSAILSGGLSRSVLDDSMLRSEEEGPSTYGAVWTSDSPLGLRPDRSRAAESLPQRGRSREKIIRMSQRLRLWWCKRSFLMLLFVALLVTALFGISVGAIAGLGAFGIR